MLTCLAPAKLNLFLHVVGRRADGYHELQTVFQFLDYGDRLTFTPTQDGLVRRGTPLPGVDEAEDLTLRAAHLLRDETGSDHGCTIQLEKRIPVGGGLGGGSSDAATTLLALNRLWGLGLPPDRLAQLGLKLGADVPVFVHGKAAWAEGVGEKLTPITLPEPWYLVVTPLCLVSTRALFSAPELRRNTPPIQPADFLAGRAGNDFEPVARARFPEVGAALDWLRTVAGPGAALSGSGASVFAAFASAADAETVARRIPGRWRHFVARGCNLSPLRMA